jgi:hypothetical protein
LVKGWHAPPDACGAGAIVLLAQGDPPHSKLASCRETWGAGRRIVMKTGLTVSRFSSQTGNPKQS